MIDFELRELKSSDIFPMVGILNKIGFKELKTVLTPDKIKEMTKIMKTQGEDDMDNTTLFGFNVILEVVGIIMNNLSKCEQDLYKFLSSVSGLTVKEVEDLAMSDFAEMIVAIVKKPEFKDFFKAVSKLFN